MLRYTIILSLLFYSHKPPPRQTKSSRGPFLEGFQDELRSIPEDREAPPPYSATIDPEWRLTYVDFAPKCYDEGRILTSPKFETFE